MDFGNALQIGIIRLWILKYHSIDHWLCFWYLGDDGMTSLHLAAQNGHIEVVHAILNQNNMPRKYINLTDEGGWTPLVWACENRHEEIIK